MPTVFKILSRLGLLVFLILSVSACETEYIPSPAFEKERILHTFLQPGDGVELQLGESDIMPTPNIDSNRVRTRLFENGILVESFVLKGNYPLSWGQDYRLEVSVDESETLRASVTLPDSIAIGLIDSTHSDTVIRRIGNQGYRHRYQIMVETPAELPGDSVYLLLSGSSQLVLLSSDDEFTWDGSEGPFNYLALPAGFSGRLSLWGKRNIAPKIFVLGPAWASLRQSIQNSQSVPVTPVSYSNVEGGGGVVDFMWVVEL